MLAITNMMLGITNVTLGITHLKVADGDAREGDVAVLGPVVLVDRVFENVEAEGGVACRQDEVEQKELTNRIADVAELVDEEEDEEIVAVAVMMKIQFVRTKLTYDSC